MENKLEITMGIGDHRPGKRKNTMPVDMELCADSRKENCPYYVRVFVETDHASFHQGFCAWKYRKSHGGNHENRYNSKL